MNDIILRLMDALLGWTLSLPRDVTLLIVALITAGCIVAARRALTDQNMLRRAAADKRRLKEIIRDAKKRGDNEAVSRAKTVKQRLAMMAFRSEIKPLFAVIIPIILVTTWGFQRLNYLPVAAGETVEIAARFPLAEAGRIVHIVPVEGLETENGWAREIIIEDDEDTFGVARWRLSGAAGESPYDMLIRHRGEAYRVGLKIGESTYEPPLVEFDSARIKQAETQLKTYRPFGVVPGLGDSGLPAWVIGYLLLAIPISSGLKRIFGVR